LLTTPVLAHAIGVAPVKQPPAPQLPQEMVKLGQSAVELTGPWKFEPGDSPIVDGKPLWAQSGFDDNTWHSMDMKPPEGSVDPFSGEEGFAPGWTERGFPDLTGYAWYRLTVRVKDPGEPLWLKMPDNFDDAYQLYANGRLVGGFGRLNGKGSSVYYARARSFQLPAPPVNGVYSLAIRFWLESDTAFFDPSVGGMHSPPVLGVASTIKLLQERDDDAAVHANAISGGVLLMLFLLAAPAVFWAWLRNRHEPMYFWLLVTLFCYIASAVSTDLFVADRIATNPESVLQEMFTRLILPCWILFWWQWFGLTASRWIPKFVGLLIAADLIAAACLRVPLYGRVVPLEWAHWLSPVHPVVGALEGILLLVILLNGLQRHRTEALLAVAPLLLIIFSVFSEVLQARFGFASSFVIASIKVGIAPLASCVLLLLIGALTVRRFLASHAQQEREQQAIEVELEQASALQQRVLVPEAMCSRFFCVDTAYFPAQTVGGDFFQVLAGEDGSLLVILGDVSGKGVSAAMLVAVLVGAILTQAEQSFDPFQMLQMLNARLAGRSTGHFATCLAMHLRSDGSVSIANAGHLAPYLNGREVATPGALPLGLVREPELSTSFLLLQPDDRLTLLSDGVVEAMSPHRELLGFERARAMSKLSAYEIAQHAITYGQQDDITVLTVQFNGAESTPVSAPVAEEPSSV
jgi:hypothetical protein